MAIRIPIVTVFDSKGLKQAQYQLNKVRGNFQNLGRNFAIAGAAFAGAAAVIGKSAQALSRIESINAQTAQTIKSMGNAANVSAGQVEDLANRLEAMTATEAESIQEGANLLLTFRNITNQLGEGNDIFNQTTEIMVDMGRALKEGASASAIRLGKALNDPIRGITALRKVGVGFSEDQENQIKLLQESGDLMGAQKIILAELQAQFGGSGQAYAATFAGQVELLNHELGALGEEATMAVMPALRELVGALRELAPEIGEKMKTAIASVDWKAFAKTLSDIITFLVQNAETIMKVVGAMFALNTIYNAGRVAAGLYSAATFILGNTFTVTAGKIGLATGALRLFRLALIGTGIGALLLLLGTAAENMANVKQKTDLTTTSVNTFSNSISGAGTQADWAAGKFVDVKNAIQAIPASKTVKLDVQVETNSRNSQLNSYLGFLGGRAAEAAGPITNPLTTGNLTGGNASTPARTSFAATLQRSVTAQNRQNKLVGLGLTAGAAELALSTVENKKQFQKLQATLSKPGVAAKRQAAFNRTAAGLSEIASLQAAQDAADQAAEASRQEGIRLAAEAAAKEAAILAEKQRVYESFAASVASTFSRIQESIMSAFSLPELGSSTDSIIRNMDKLLARVKSFSANITKLSSMGLDPKLLQQVINAGPIAGAKLAANLVAGGVGGLAAINKGYAELGTVAGEIGMTGTQAQFGTAQQQQIININIEGGLDSSAAIGKAVVDAVRAYERTSGAVWQGA